MTKPQKEILNDQINRICTILEAIKQERELSFISSTPFMIVEDRCLDTIAEITDGPMGYILNGSVETAIPKGTLFFSKEDAQNVASELNRDQPWASPADPATMNFIIMGRLDYCNALETKLKDQMELLEDVLIEHS